MTAHKPLNALDRAFLAVERRDVMMHVGALLQFSPPPGGGEPLGVALRDELARITRVERPWNLRLSRPDLLSSPLQSWEEEPHVDLEYHVRRSSLASPGDQRELGTLVSRLHGTPLDFHRPPWEAYFIEGLENGRFALYVKVHHALIDGYTGMRTLVRSLSHSADNRTTPLFFVQPENVALARTHVEEPPIDALLRVAREQLDTTREVGRAVMSAVQAFRHHDRELVSPLQAPRSVLNQRITRSRRFATASATVESVKQVASAAGGTVNDVVLAVCGSALRRYLGELGTLPEPSLVAMVPVNIRPKDDPGGSGNALGAILASLATDVPDPQERLATIIASTRRAKDQLSGMSRNAVLPYSALALAPMMLSFLPGAAGRLLPAFNIVVSNLPGPESPLYFRGYRLDEMYPLSIPFHGYGLNITVQSYSGMLGFGFTGCRDTLPHLQRLAVYGRESLEEMAQ
ncbi:MAG: Wax ester synthase/acyl-CoA:diacylglycerol acyltransferase [Labilithrix sp.]|nr:Wax ester synthase/acyl-CoA:diacylglycerol acyltransferase [Labilithrix sp.]